MAEWLNAPVLKTDEGESPPRVRIPESPPLQGMLMTIYPELGNSYYKHRKNIIFYYNGAGGNFLASTIAKYGVYDTDDIMTYYPNTNEYIFHSDRDLSAAHLHKFLHTLPYSDGITRASKTRYRECIDFFKTTNFVFVHSGDYAMFLHHMGSLKHNSGFRFKIPNVADKFSCAKEMIEAKDPDFVLLEDPMTKRVDRQYRNVSRTLKRNKLKVVDIEYEKLVIHQDFNEVKKFAQSLIPNVNNNTVTEIQNEIKEYHYRNIELILKNS